LYVNSEEKKVVTMSREHIQINAESGQTMAEYTVVLGVITLAIVTTFSLLSGAIDDAFMRTLEIVETAF
jgi:Flp pilus assembly pilin Flp